MEHGPLKMICVHNCDYEDCLTIGEPYMVSRDEKGMWYTVDDDGEPLNSMIDRWVVDLSE
jgi:hypothetical protein